MATFDCPGCTQRERRIKYSGIVGENNGRIEELLRGNWSLIDGADFGFLSEMLTHFRRAQHETELDFDARKALGQCHIWRTDWADRIAIRFGAIRSQLAKLTGRA